ncbi:aldehyde dehydrogenase family protein [Mycobacterium sp. E796]|uniref:aldehyde dehydrogenase family protein n=1 Tax=Mycobacterium sp. E796 TaxID=1834151 RepID=UPI0007FE56AE|nr:aldehyde dehydrogenase family protein [Mycobacterium sp. E796]OBI51989.1 aldehyde dehydrogenase [Mycobacterium sp. E796]
MAPPTEVFGCPTPEDVERLFERQRRHRWVAKDTSAAERVAVLQRLRDQVQHDVELICAALHQDLLRSPKASMIEVHSVLADLDDAIANLESWMAPTELPIGPPPLDRVASQIRYEARGVCLLFGPWNFPFALVFQPLVAIVAAGNTAIVKPNEMAPATSAVVARIIKTVFSDEHVAVVEGDVTLAERLLELPVDHIFFTGSPAVGRRVMRAAAAHLASVTLELGGKCPAVVFAGSDIASAAAQIAAGKHQNAGQVCLSPDHVWVQRSVREEFVEHYGAWIRRKLYDNGELSAEKLGKIIDRRNFDRIEGYVDDALRRGAPVHWFGDSDPESTVMAPAVVTDVKPDFAIMKEEIFGPVLPVLDFDNPDEVVAWLQDNEKPLALYAFAEDGDASVDALLAATSSGGVTVNGWALHYGDNRLPFGGIGGSGMGRYHGAHGFRELSHARSISTLSAIRQS